MALIETNDLALYLNQPSLVDDPRAELVCALASAVISDYLQNEGVGPTTVHTDRVFDGPVRGSVVFLLPGFPIQNVAKVEVKWCPTDSWTELPTTDYSWSPSGFVSLTHRADASEPGCRWPRTQNSIRVTYTSGSDSVPMSVKAVTLGIASRGLLNPIGILNEQIGDYSVGYGAAHSAWLQLDPLELSVISAYADWGVG